MTILPDRVNRASEAFAANRAAMEAQLARHDAELAVVNSGGGQKYTARHIARGKLPVRQRVELLLDPDTPFLELSPLAAWGRSPAAGAVPPAASPAGAGEGDAPAATAAPRPSAANRSSIYFAIAASSCVNGAKLAACWTPTCAVRFVSSAAASAVAVRTASAAAMTASASASREAAVIWARSRGGACPSSAATFRIPEATRTSR